MLQRRSGSRFPSSARAYRPAIEAILTTEARAQTEATSSDPPSRGRILGVDVARALAILGMLAVHVGPTDGNDPLGRLYAVPHGRASLLFVLVAGVGLSLLSSSSSTPLGVVRAKLAWRAALLLPAGLALQELNHGANVILQDYALLFVLAILLIDVPRRWLLGLSVAFAILGPVAYLMGRASAPTTFDRSPTTLSQPFLDTLHGLVLSGPYPLITWAAPLLLGMWLGRLDLRSPRLRHLLIAVGAAVGVGSFLLGRVLVALLGPPSSFADLRFLATSAAHGQMPLWLVGGTGLAVLVLGLSLIAADRARRITWPLAATGQLALTIYVGHLVVLHAAPDLTTSDAVSGALAILVVFAAVILITATIWRTRFDRGPLELALHPSWIRPRTARQPRSARGARAYVAQTFRAPGSH